MWAVIDVKSKYPHYPYRVIERRYKDGHIEYCLQRHQELLHTSGLNKCWVSDSVYDSQEKACKELKRKYQSYLTITVDTEKVVSCG